MTKAPKSTQDTAPARDTQGAPSNLQFKAIALPALAAATRRKPVSRTTRRVGLVLDPARYAD